MFEGTSTYPAQSSIHWTLNGVSGLTERKGCGLSTTIATPIAIRWKPNWLSYTKYLILSPFTYFEARAVGLTTPKLPGIEEWRAWWGLGSRWKLRRGSVFKFPAAGESVPQFFFSLNETFCNHYDNASVCLPGVYDTSASATPAPRLVFGLSTQGVECCISGNSVFVCYAFIRRYVLFPCNLQSTWYRM